MDPEGKDFGKLLIFKYIICSVLYIALLTIKKFKKVSKIPLTLKKFKILPILNNASFFVP